ncbi:MAG: DUF7446 family protein [Candidatus Woesearchaeota archaeon]
MLEDIRLAKSALTDNIYIGKIKDNNYEWKGEKKDVTNDFIKAVIDRFEGYREVIESQNNDKYYMIEVKEISKKEANEFKNSLE